MLIQSQNTSIRPLTTAHLAQTMTLLELTSEELRQKIESELANNPALELVNEKRCPNCQRPLTRSGPCPICSRPLANNGDEPIVFVSSRDDFRTYKGRSSNMGEMPDEEWAAAVEELPAFVLRQIAPELAVEDRLIASHILTSLTEDGLLTIPIIEIARYHHALPSRVEKVIQLIQRAEPIGVGSATPQEALLVQLKVLSETKEVPPAAEKAIREGMDLLSRHAYSELSRLLKVSHAEARETARFIADNLYPFPGRSHWGDMRAGSAEPQVYRQPDIIISRQNNDPDAPLVVEVISPFANSLRVSPLFRQLLPDAPKDKIKEWQEAVDQANLLVKCLQQRNHTIVRLMQRIVMLQQQFILKGDAHLTPVTRASLAEDLDVHESTISRAVSGKSIQLPNGRIIPLSKMFDRSLHIRTALRQIIAEETTPMSDTQLSKILHKQGFPVARRTVAKYRAMEGILPARLRQPSAVGVK